MMIELEENLNSRKRKNKMLTGKDLLDIEFFLAQRARVVNQPEENKIIINELRSKIAKELDKIKIKISRTKE